MEVERVKQDIEIHKLRNVELAEANRQNGELLDQLRRQTKLLEQLAITDPLTGLFNRRYIQEFSSRFGQTDSELPTQFAIVMADLDNFKSVNDRFTHLGGDEVLKTSAALITSVVRDCDVVIRAGGEEFMILMPDVGREEGCGICEQIRQALAGHSWASTYPDLHVTISMGMAHSSEIAKEPRRQGVDRPAADRCRYTVVRSEVDGKEPDRIRDPELGQRMRLSRARYSAVDVNAVYPGDRGTGGRIACRL